MKKRIVSLFMALVMTLSLIPTAVWAEALTTRQESAVSTAAETAGETTEAAEIAGEEKSFLLLAANGIRVIIAPEQVAYQPGQTIAQALAASGHTFTGMDPETGDGLIGMIDDSQGQFIRCDEKGGYDLSRQADEIAAMMFVTREVDDAQAGALYEMACAMLQWQQAGQEKPQLQKFAQAQYDAASQALVSGGDYAALGQALNDRMDAYQQYEAADKRPLLLAFLGLDGEALTDYTFTAEDPYGNRAEFAAGDTAALAAGTYTFTLTAGYNGAGGEMTVDETGAVSVAGETVEALCVPRGKEWIAAPLLLPAEGDPERDAYPAEEGGDHATTVLLPDTVERRGGVYLYAVPGADAVLSESGEQYQWAGSELRPYALYTDVYGKERGEEANLNRLWQSTQRTLNDVVDAGAAGNTLRLEARAAVDGYTMYQAWEVTLERTPTLCALLVTADQIPQDIGFSSAQTQYECTVTAGEVVLTPSCFGGGDYAVTVNGEALTDGSYTLALGESGETTAEVAVAMESGREKVYTITFTRQKAVPVRIACDAGVTVKVYNPAGAEVGADESGVYPLTPGQLYTYITTKDVWYHARGSFTVPQDGAGMTVEAAAPVAEDWLTELMLASANNKEKSDKYLAAEDFRTETHRYDAVIKDVYRTLFVWAAAQEGDRLTARYGGSETALKGGGQTVNQLSGCLQSGAAEQLVTVRVYRTEQSSGSAVEYYQDYEIAFARELTLENVTLTVDESRVALYQMEDGAETEDDSFDPEVSAYSTTVVRSAAEAVLTVRVPFAGYTVRLDGRDCAPDTDPETEKPLLTTTIVLPLDETREAETFRLQACSPEAKDAVTYAVTLKKGAPVATTVQVVDGGGQAVGEAMAALYDKRSNSRVWPDENGAFQLVGGLFYDCVTTCAGYKGDKLTFRAGEKNARLTITLEKAADSASKNNGVSSAWPSFRGNAEANGVVDVKTPISRKTAVLSWANQLGKGYSSTALSCPILIAEGGVDYLIVYSGTKLFKVESITGTVVATGEMYCASSFAINSATFGDGMLFVALKDGVVQAFDAKTLQSLWLYQDPLKGQPNCPLTYHAGYVYTGFWNSETADASYVCLSATDEDPSQTLEPKLARWTHTSAGGFYWAGAYVSDDFLLVGTDDGDISYLQESASLLCIDPRTGKVMDTLSGLRGDIRCNIARYEGRFYFTSKGGCFYSVAVEQQVDGSWKITDKQELRLDNYSSDTSKPPMSTCTPVLYNGRAYIGVSGTSQFGAYSGHNITVIDLASWGIAYKVPTRGYPQTSGLLTKGYGDKVYVYFFDNYTPGTLRMLEDAPGQTSPSLVTAESYQVQGVTKTVNAAYALFTPSDGQSEYAICSPITDGYGTLFFKNDSANLMALTSTVKRITVAQGPEKTAYTAGEDFDPTGMLLTVHYSNGTERTLPVSREINGKTITYFTFNKTVSEADGEGFAIRFAPLMYQSDEQGGEIPAAEGVTIPLEVTPAEYPRGDVNGDTQVDVYDLQLLYEICSGIRTNVDLNMYNRANCNQDSKVDALDMQALYSFLTCGKWDVPSGDTHAIAVKSSTPQSAKVKQGQEYRLAMADVFTDCGHDVVYTLANGDYGEHTKVFLDGDGKWYLVFTNPRMGDYPLTITAVCQQDKTVSCRYALTVTVIQGDPGDERQYGYDESPADSVKVYVTVSNDGVPLVGNDRNRTVLANLEVELPYFDLDVQELSEFKRFGTDGGQGDYINETVVRRPTLLHLYLYLLGVYCQGYDPADVTHGRQTIRGSISNYTQDVYQDLRGGDPWSGIGGEFSTLEISGSATHLYMENFWGHDQNLMYFRNHVYPLQSPGWGATADYILLKDGDVIDLAMFSDWSFYHRGAFACFDQDSYALTAGETLDFRTLKYDTQSVADGGGETTQDIAGLTVYVYDEDWRIVDVLEGEGAAYRREFTKKGLYYLVAFDASAGTSEACYAPATARVTVS